MKNKVLHRWIATLVIVVMAFTIMPISTYAASPRAYVNDSVIGNVQIYDTGWYGNLTDIIYALPNGKVTWQPDTSGSAVVWYSFNRGSQKYCIKVYFPTTNDGQYATGKRLYKSDKYGNITGEVASGKVYNFFKDSTYFLKSGKTQAKISTQVYMAYDDKQESRYKLVNPDGSFVVNDPPAFNISVGFGTGLSTKIKVLGVGVEVGGKRYYDITDMFTEHATESLNLSLKAEITDYIQLGGEITGTVDASTREHLKNQGFLGLKIGNTLIGWGDLPNDEFVIGVELEAYVVVGGHISVNWNIGQLWDRWKISSQSTVVPVVEPPKVVNGIVSNGIYPIIHYYENVIDIESASTDSGVRAILYSAHTGNNQKFNFEQQSDGSYKITAVHSGKVLAPENSSHGTQITQQDWNGSSLQKWIVESLGDGWYKFINKQTGYCLDNYGGNGQIYDKIVQWEDNGTVAQWWKLN